MKSSLIFLVSAALALVADAVDVLMHGVQRISDTDFYLLRDRMRNVTEKLDTLEALAESKKGKVDPAARYGADIAALQNYWNVLKPSTEILNSGNTAVAILDQIQRYQRSIEAQMATLTVSNVKSKIPNLVKVAKDKRDAIWNVRNPNPEAETRQRKDNGLESISDEEYNKVEDRLNYMQLQLNDLSIEKALKPAVTDPAKPDNIDQEDLNELLRRFGEVNTGLDLFTSANTATTTLDKITTYKQQLATELAEVTPLNVGTKLFGIEKLKNDIKWEVEYVRPLFIRDPNAEPNVWDKILALFKN